MRDHNAVCEVNARTKDANLDPITGTPGAHPVGTGVGAAGGGAAGAVIGAAAGPIGAGVGLLVGAIAGGLGGKGVAEMIDPTLEDAYWREQYARSAYVENGESYDIYRPAYQMGYEGCTRYPGKTYEEAESDLQRDYEESGWNSSLPWEKAKYAARDAWDRVESSFPSERR